MTIIGLGHYSRTGKDSFANALLDHLNFIAPHIRVKKLSFAWKLKQICHDLYSWAGVLAPEEYETEAGAKLRNIRLPKLASDKYPEGPNVVELWIDFGTPAVREQVYDRTWADYVLKKDHKCDVLIAPDCRFLNEVESIRAAGGILIKVVRPGYGPRNSPADLNLFHWREWDGVIGYTGMLGELKLEAKRVSRAIVSGQEIQFDVENTELGYLAEVELNVPEEWLQQHARNF